MLLATSSTTFLTLVIRVKWHPMCCCRIIDRVLTLVLRIKWQAISYDVASNIRQSLAYITRQSANHRALSQAASYDVASKSEEQTGALAPRLYTGCTIRTVGISTRPCHHLVAQHPRQLLAGGSLRTSTRPSSELGLHCVRILIQTRGEGRRRMISYVGSVLVINTSLPRGSR